MSVSRETFVEWRRPRFGTENPTRMDNALWASLVHDRINAYQVNKQFGHETWGTGATWCFDRYGRTATELDGRTIYIGGEHEDYYDPDFYIYNDVIVVDAAGAVAIYGYPRDVFPPTDFHTATLDGDRIWIVGSLGYADARQPGTTQVCRLDLATMAIERIATNGDGPGWIHKHEAALADGAIVVRGGLVEIASSKSLEENIDEWALDLTTLVWTRRTARDWQRWAMRRTDGERSLLWEIRQLKWKADHAHLYANDAVEDRFEVKEKLGGEPDLALVDELYRFEGATLIPERDDDEYNVFRIEVDGVIVRFAEESDRIAVMVEGRLDEARLRAVQDHVLRCASALHFTAWEIER